MPCWTVRTTSVELKAANTDLLVDALEAEGFRVHRRGDYVTAYRNDVRIKHSEGQLTMESQNTSQHTEIALDIKKSYAVKAVERSLKKYNWKTQKYDAKKRQFNVAKRSY